VGSVGVPFEGVSIIAVKGAVMSVDSTDSGFIGSLFSLARTQLRIQGIISAGLHLRLRMIIAMDLMMAGVAAVYGGVYYLWIGALALLILSVALAGRALRVAGRTSTGPSIAELCEYRENQDGRLAEKELLDALARDVQRNEPVLARGAWLFDKALLLFVGGVVIDFAGRLI
jgi:hypothetical protein